MGWGGARRGDKSSMKGREELGGWWRADTKAEGDNELSQSTLLPWPSAASEGKTQNLGPWSKNSAPGNKPGGLSTQHADPWLWRAETGETEGPQGQDLFGGRRDCKAPSTMAGSGPPSSRVLSPGASPCTECRVASAWPSPTYFPVWVAEA